MCDPEQERDCLTLTILFLGDSRQESSEWPLPFPKRTTSSQGLEVAQKHAWPIVSLVPVVSILSRDKMVNT